MSDIAQQRHPDFESITPVEIKTLWTLAAIRWRPPRMSSRPEQTGKQRLPYANAVKTQTDKFVKELAVDN
jgi:hypothetical protein